MWGVIENEAAVNLRWWCTVAVAPLWAQMPRKCSGPLVGNLSESMSGRSGMEAAAETVNVDEPVIAGGWLGSNSAQSVQRRRSAVISFGTLWW